MLSIFLLILKILGIVLLSVLGIAIFLILIILFVPIRYKLYAKINGNASDTFAYVKISWLLHILSFKLLFKNSKLEQIIRIIGIKYKKKDKNKGKIQKSKKQKNANSSVSYNEYKIESYDEANNEIKEVDSLIESKKEESENIYIEGLEQTKDDSKNLNIFIKVKKFVSFIGGIIFKIRDIMANIKNKIFDICNNISYYSDFCCDEKNKKVLSFCVNQLTTALKAIKPKKIKGNLRYGSDDPAKTGQVLVIASILYPLYGSSIKLEPDFENEVFIGDVIIKGRIYVFSLIKVAWKLYFNKELKRTIKLLKREEK